MITNRGEMKGMLIVAIIGVVCMAVLGYLVCRLMDKERRLSVVALRFTLVNEVAIAMVAIITVIVRRYLISIYSLKLAMYISCVGCLVMMIIVVVGYEKLLRINNIDNNR